MVSESLTYERGKYLAFFLFQPNSENHNSPLLSLHHLLRQNSHTASGKE